MLLKKLLSQNSIWIFFFKQTPGKKKKKALILSQRIVQGSETAHSEQNQYFLASVLVFPTT